jgi:gamma-glutamylcyclotransferase (GGCT)/AIG2-like uncharacterized protein YtfP
MSTKESYLFIYGTLRNGMPLAIDNDIAIDIEWVGHSQIKGRLYEIGEYPGALPAENDKSVIKGEVLKLNKPGKVLKLLDEYEGYDPKNLEQSEYYRKKELIQMEDGSTVEAWVYWYNLPVTNKRRIANHDYLKYLKKKQSA